MAFLKKKKATWNLPGCPLESSILTFPFSSSRPMPISMAILLCIFWCRSPAVSPQPTSPSSLPLSPLPNYPLCLSRPLFLLLSLVSLSMAPPQSINTSLPPCTRADDSCSEGIEDIGGSSVGHEELPLAEVAALGQAAAHRRRTATSGHGWRLFLA